MVGRHGRIGQRGTVGLEGAFDLVELLEQLGRGFHQAVRRKVGRKTNSRAIEGAAVEQSRVGCYFLSEAAGLAPFASFLKYSPANFFWKRSTRPRVSTKVFCPV